MKLKGSMFNFHYYFSLFSLFFSVNLSMVLFMLSYMVITVKKPLAKVELVINGLWCQSHSTRTGLIILVLSLKITSNLCVWFIQEFRVCVFTMMVRVTDLKLSIFRYYCVSEKHLTGSRWTWCSLGSRGS